MDVVRNSLSTKSRCCSQTSNGAEWRGAMHRGALHRGVTDVRSLIFKTLSRNFRAGTEKNGEKFWIRIHTQCPKHQLQPLSLEQPSSLQSAYSGIQKRLVIKPKPSSDEIVSTVTSPWNIYAVLSLSLCLISCHIYAWGHGAGSIPDGVIGIFYWLHSGCAMILGST